MYSGQKLTKTLIYFKDLYILLTTIRSPSDDFRQQSGVQCACSKKKLGAPTLFNWKLEGVIFETVI